MFGIVAAVRRAIAALTAFAETVENATTELRRGLAQDAPPAIDTTARPVLPEQPEPAKPEPAGKSNRKAA